MPSTPPRRPPLNAPRAEVREKSSNPFEGGSNDVPISSIARRIEIEMRLMLGEQTDLKPVEAKYDILLSAR
jgi:putative membrane protein